MTDDLQLAWYFPVLTILHLKEAEIFVHCTKPKPKGAEVQKAAHNFE